MKKAEDVMNRRVIYFSPENTILEISQKFAEYNISGAPIVEGRRVVGIISNSDIIKFVNERLHKDLEEVSAHTSSMILHLSKLIFGNSKMKKELESVMNTKVGDIMVRNVKFVAPETEISEVIEIMTKHGINRLPVVDNGKLVGIIARDDLIKAFLVE